MRTSFCCTDAILTPLLYHLSRCHFFHIVTIGAAACSRCRSVQELLGTAFPDNFTGRFLDLTLVFLLDLPEETENLTFDVEELDLSKLCLVPNLVPLASYVVQPSLFGDRWPPIYGLVKLIL